MKLTPQGQQYGEYDTDGGCQLGVFDSQASQHQNQQQGDCAGNVRIFVGFCAVVNGQQQRYAHQCNADQNRASHYMADIPHQGGDCESSQTRCGGSFTVDLLALPLKANQHADAQCHGPVSQVHQVEHQVCTGAMAKLPWEPSSSAISAGMSRISTSRPCRLTIPKPRK
ncbi:hypothetical protein D3C81_1086730 [compost metagenome]